MVFGGGEMWCVEEERCGVWRRDVVCRGGEMWCVEERRDVVCGGEERCGVWRRKCLVCGGEEKEKKKETQMIDGRGFDERRKKILNK